MFVSGVSLLLISALDTTNQSASPVKQTWLSKLVKLEVHKFREAQNAAYVSLKLLTALGLNSPRKKKKKCFKKPFKSSILHYKSVSFIWPTLLHNHLSFIPPPVLYYSIFCSIFAVIRCSENYGKNDINWTLCYKKKSGWRRILAQRIIELLYSNACNRSWVPNETIWLCCFRWQSCTLAFWKVDTD